MSQKFIVFKIAKNMGSTIKTILEMNKINYIKLLSENQFDEEKINNSKIIFIGHTDCIQKFKIKFNNIYENAIKVIIFRNPYERIESSYNYMYDRGYNKSYSYYFKNINKYNMIDTKIFFVHFAATQAKSMDYNENEYHSKKYIWLLMDNIDTIFEYFKNNLGLEINDNIHKNKMNSINKKKMNQHDIELFNKIFKDDIILYKNLKYCI